MNGDHIQWTESFPSKRMVEIIIQGNTMERHPLEEGVPQGSPVLPMHFVIYSSGLIKWVQEYVSEAEGQIFVQDFGWVATGRDVNNVVLILERCAAKSLEWASRRGLQLDTATMETVLFTCRRGHRKHLRPNLTAMIRARYGSIRFNAQGTCWLSVWMDTNLTLKEHHN